MLLIETSPQQGLVVNFKLSLLFPYLTKDHQQICDDNKLHLEYDLSFTGYVV